MAKAKKSLKGLGARYGIKLRKQYTKVHLQLKQKRSCPDVVHKPLVEMLLEFGLVKNVALKLLELHMTLNYSAKITVDAKDKNNAIFDSVNTDNEFYPENPVKTKIKLDKKLVISAETDQIAHLRANLNSTLRLIQASYDTIESVKI